jgi:adenylate kinase family enzyme
LGERHAIPHFEIDRLLWQERWVPAPLETYVEQHERILSGENWVIDGLGHKNSISMRIDRATEIILIDMPLWMHFWLAAERQIAWQSGKLDHTPRADYRPCRRREIYFGPSGKSNRTGCRTYAACASKRRQPARR